jgi:hypothetical protein
MIDQLSLDDDTNLCLSGGADGADLQWGMCAGLLGHKVIHWSYAGHRTFAPTMEVVELNDSQLAEANPFIELASKSLSKQVPKKPWVKKLIQRNYYQIAWSGSIYAITDIVDGVPQGGTAWAIQMYLDRTNIKHQCYVYDQARASWCVWVGGDEVWCRIDAPPQPSGIWAGVGSRNLLVNGKQAIRNLMEFVKPTDL